MKIRTGFVSNSSSSSFCCPVCNIVESGWDGEYDIPTFTCDDCWETMCGEHVGYDEEEDTHSCPLCSLEVITDSQLLEYIEKVNPKLSLDGVREEIKKKYKSVDAFHKALGIE